MFCSVHGSCVTCSSSSTTTRVSLFFLKSKRVILGLREAENDIDVMQKSCACTHTKKKNPRKDCSYSRLTKRTGRSCFGPQTRALQWGSVPGCTHCHLWPGGRINKMWCGFVRATHVTAFSRDSIPTLKRNKRWVPWPYACRPRTSPATWPCSGSGSQPVQASGPCKIVRLRRGILSKVISAFTMTDRMTQYEMILWIIQWLWSAKHDDKTQSATANHKTPPS